MFIKLVSSKSLMVRDVPLVAAGMHLDIRYFKAELLRLEAMDGWQYVESTIYDLGTSHAVHTMSSRSLLFATPVKFVKKLKNFPLLSVELEYYPSRSPYMRGFLAVQSVPIAIYEGLFGRAKCPHRRI